MNQVERSMCEANHGQGAVQCLNVVYGECPGFSPQPAYCTQGIQPPIQTVPEPMTWALIVVGLVIMLLIVRRRHG